MPRKMETKHHRLDVVAVHWNPRRKIRMELNVPIKGRYNKVKYRCSTIGLDNEGRIPKAGLGLGGRSERHRSRTRTHGS